MNTLSAPVISSITAGLLILLQMALAFIVAMTRRRLGQSLGEGDHAVLQRAVRRHGNLAENAAIFLVGLALMEIMGANRIYVEACAGLFVLARISHAIGLSMENTVNPWRIGGVLASIAAAVAVAVKLITIGVHHL